MIKNLHPNHYHLYLLTSAYATSTFASGILMPIYAFFVQKIGGGIMETAWAIAVYSILTGIGTIIIHKTKWSHTYRTQCLWGGWLIWLMSMIVYLLMSNIMVLFISQVFNAVGDALCEPVFDAEYGEKIAQDPSAGWALFNATTTIFSGVAAVVGGLVVTYYSFDVLLYCVIGVATLSFMLIAYYVHINGKNSSE